jgi:hypothetical protein
MGSGYMVLLWDGYGSGLVMINPRFYTKGVDMYGNPRNWFPFHSAHQEDRGHLEMELLEQLEIEPTRARVIWD